MLESLFTFDIAPLNLVVRALIVYLSVLILLRISGKKQIGQMGATEFVAVLLISNAVQNSMNGGDNSLVGGLLLALVLILVSSAIAFMTYKSDLCSRIFEGTPTLLIHKGKVVQKNLSREQMNQSDLKIMLRKQGLHFIDEIETAILEADGTLSVTRTSEPVIHTT